MMIRPVVSFPVLLCALSLGLALAARHRLIEPAHLTAYCDAGAADFLCTVRGWTIQSFVHQRIGWAALGLAVVAAVAGSRALALTTAAAALIAGSAALALYSAELGAPAALLAALVFARPAPVLSQASASSIAQKPSA